MSDIDGAAAPAESVSAPELPLDAPNPISTEAGGHPEPDAKPEGKPEAKPEVKTEKADKPPTTREALEKAAAKVEKDAKVAEAKPDAKAADKPAEIKTEAQKRDLEGKFAPKDGEKPADKSAEPVKPSFTAGEAPARFSPDAKARWAETHETVRAETERAIRELTEGHTKYKASAERDAGLNEFHEMAQRGGTTVKEALSKYVNMENQLRADPIKGLEIVCQNAGLSLKDVAAHVLGQTPDQNASHQDATVRELKSTIQQLQQQIGNVAQGFQQQQTASVGKEVAEFAAAHPRFEELNEDIAFFLKTRTSDLSEAYKLAERLNPAPAAASTTAASPAPTIDHSAQTEKGQKSINGAPNAGSNPAAQRPSTSIKESLKRAIAQVG